MNKKRNDWAIVERDFLSPVIFDEIEPELTDKFIQNSVGRQPWFLDPRSGRSSLKTLRRKLNRFRDRGSTTRHEKNHRPGSARESFFVRPSAIGRGKVFLAANRTFSDGRVDKRLYHHDDNSLKDRMRVHFDALVKTGLLDCPMKTIKPYGPGGDQ